MRVVATVIAWVVSYLIASSVWGVLAGESTSAPRVIVAFLIAGVVAAAVYTSLKEGPRSVMNLWRRGS